MARSNWYGSPIKIFEYGALGKAIIAPDNIPVNDVMIHNEDGLLISNDLFKLSYALLTLLNDKEKREILGKTFQKKVLNEHTWINNARVILNSVK